MTLGKCGHERYTRRVSPMGAKHRDHSPYRNSAHHYGPRLYRLLLVDGFFDRVPCFPGLVGRASHFLDSISRSITGRVSWLAQSDNRGFGSP